MSYKKNWPGEDYRPGDLVITIDGGIAEFICFKMDDTYATLLFDTPERGHHEVYHRGQFRLWKKREDKKS